MKVNGVVPDIAVYDVLLNILFKDCHLQDASELFGQLVKARLKPDVETCNTMICGYCSLKSLDEAISLFEKLTQGEFGPNAITFTILIDAFCKEGRMDDAVLMFSKMLEPGPNVIMYSCLIDGYFKSENLKSAFELHEEMFENKISPNIVSYSILIDGHCKHGQVEEVSLAFHCALDRHLLPDVIACSILIRGYCKAGRLAEAMTGVMLNYSVGIIAFIVQQYVQFSPPPARKGNTVDNGNQGSLTADSLVKRGSSRQNISSHQSQAGQIIEGEKSLMETEGRVFSDFSRNSSEELFLKSLMESSVGMPVPTMETLGFKNLPQNFRTDSEELFKSWLTNGEARNFAILIHQNSSSIAQRTRLASRRISAELATLSTQPQGNLPQKNGSDAVHSQNNSGSDEISALGDLNQNSVRIAVEKGMQPGDLFLAKAWFHSLQPMTRSRSSELRRRYAAMQGAHTTPRVEDILNASAIGVNKLKGEFPEPNGFNDLPMCDIPSQMGTFISPSNSSSSTFYTPQISNVDNVSSVVSMLKGTLERKRLGNQMEKEALENSSNGLSHAPEVMVNSCFNQRLANQIHEIPGGFAEVTTDQVKDAGVLQKVQGSIDLDFEGFVNPTNTIQMSTVSREASQSESSAAAPVVSSGFDMCDGPTNSSHNLIACETSRKQVGNGRSSQNGSKGKDFRGRIIDNLKDDRKRGGLVRFGSVSSTSSVDRADPTKKRRVERSRKMAEAKERSSTPAIPSDMQTILKRCENLEKEVRSLKLNLSFMNRKDSEQTKQIEELQQQNEELCEEKERLLEEIERILGESGTM
ncbi:hypothetical protein SLA2020_341910 [Shorea laevis]